MFGEVAGRYDLLNHVLSGTLDVWWRRRTARRLGPDDSPVLDLCCGTGDQAIALHRRGARVAAADFCFPMLTRARTKFERLAEPRPAPFTADGLRLPLRDERLGALTVSFGVRNLEDLEGGLAEMARVLRPGGRLLVLEFALPTNAGVRGAYLGYFKHVLPRIGRLLSGHASAYDYLPDSVIEFPQRQDFLDRLIAAGFLDPAWDDLSAGTVCLYSARRS